MSRVTFTEDYVDGLVKDGNEAIAERDARIAALEAERNALALEAAYLRGEIKQHSECTHFCRVCGDDDPCITDDVCRALDNTPITDSFLREVRADAILFASYQLPDGGKYQDSIQVLAQEVRDGDTQVSFPVKQLRAGEAV